MNKYLVILGIAVLIIAVVLTVYFLNQAESDRFVGTWMSDDNVQMIFYSNGSYAVPPAIYGTYSIQDRTLRFTIVGGTPYTRDYDFSNNYQTLTIINPEGDDAILIKQ
jgi:hypothetical protein